jgi:hypothetical protein
MKQSDDPPLALAFAACRSMIIRTVPPHVRRGFLRLYLAVAAPWVVWYGYQLLDAINRHRPQRYVDEALRSLLIVPIGAPIIFVILVWVVAGFQKSALRSDVPKAEPTPASPPSSVDFYPIIARAVASLADNTPEARQAVYERARSILLTQLSEQLTPDTQIAREQKALEAATEKVEMNWPAGLSKSFRGRKQTRNNQLKIAPKSREPIIWQRASLIDVTCMSLWWVARLPRGTLRR